MSIAFEYVKSIHDKDLEATTAISKDKTIESIHPILDLQESVGNQRVLNQTEGCSLFPQRCPTGGACHLCRTSEDTSIQDYIQPKLKIGTSGDRYEQEANRMADSIVQAGCTPESVEEKESGGIRSITPQVEIGDDEDQTYVHKMIRKGGRGRPLESDMREFMDVGFRFDFGDVRVHTDSNAEMLTSRLGAEAATSGRDIFFGSGRYSPETQSGKRLLAHELTHVVQQRGGGNGLQMTPTPNVRRRETALKAVSHAKSMMDDNIWFDSWGNDSRDNNNNGRIDDPREQVRYDGLHYFGSYSAKVCRYKWFTTDECPDRMERTIKVKYKVCVDVPRESYRAAGIRIPLIRRIREIIPWFRRSRDFRTWTEPSLPSIMLPGDFVAVQSGGHNHSGIATTLGYPKAGLFIVINLPGPTSRRNLGTYWPSATNDLFLMPWPYDVDFVARPVV